MALLLLFAFVAGLLTILAPCTLPVVPLVVGAGTGGGARRPLGIVIGLALTFTIATIVLASALAAIGVSTAGLRVLAVIALGVVGLSLAWPAFGQRLEGLLSPLAGIGLRFGAGQASAAADRPSGFRSGLALGAAIGLVWAPCVGPLMAGVIAVAATRGPSVETVAIALAYSAGAAIPLLAIGRWGRGLIARFGPAVRGDGLRRGFGALTLAAAVAIGLGLDTPIQNAITAVLPAGWSAALYSVEQQPAVQQEIAALNDGPANGTALGPTAGNTTSPGNATGPGGATSTSRPADPNEAAAGLPAPIAADLPATVALGDYGPAPELAGITTWLNSDPLSLAGLRGRVVLVHFWTFGCFNCRNVQPFVKGWYDRYAPAGLEVLSVHTPELSFEKDIANVRKAVVDQGVRYPVAFDPDYRTWNAYGNSYWPASYFVDRAGRIRFVHFGEGAYPDQERVIRELLAEPAPTASR